MAKGAIRPSIVAMWVVALVVAGFVATPTLAAQSAAGPKEANGLFWAVVGILFTLIVGVWLLSSVVALLTVIFGPPTLWIRNHLAEHPPRITIDHDLPRR